MIVTWILFTSLEFYLEGLYCTGTPYAWDVIQLAIICTGDIVVPVHYRFINDFSTACYVITRHHAEKLARNHVRGEKYKLDNGVKPSSSC